MVTRTAEVAIQYYGLWIGHILTLNPLDIVQLVAGYFFFPFLLGPFGIPRFLFYFILQYFFFL